MSACSQSPALPSPSAFAGASSTPTAAPTTAANAPDGSTTYQASARDYVLLRIGDGESTQAACLSFQNGATVTMSLDGSSVPVAMVSCGYDGSIAGWRVDYRFLSPPLTPGIHSARATMVFVTVMTFARSIAI